MGSKISKAVRRRPAADQAAVTQTLTRQTSTPTPPGTDMSRDPTPASRGVNAAAGSEGRQETSLPYLTNVSPRVTFHGESAAAAATSQPDNHTHTTSANLDNMNAAEQMETRAAQERARDFEEVDAATHDVLTNAPPCDLQLVGGQAAVSTSVELPQFPFEQIMTNEDVSPAPPSEPTIQCIVCCEEFPKKDEHKKVTYPCRPCGSPFCGSCLKKMFIEAAGKTSRMPPRCCGQLQLHVARPFLSMEEAAAFRTKYDEWSTQNPFYCPVPTCSVFIPTRLLPRQMTKVKVMPDSPIDGAVEGKGKQRVDSVIGTPESPLIDCPACKTSICIQCRQLAHPNSLCPKLEFGQIDEATAELLKGWGYKRCPKCGNGVRRMFGCNHMECLCGAHWCWVCQLPRDECDGGCYEDEDGDESDYDEEVPLLDEQPAAGSTQIGGLPNAEVTEAPQPTRRERNLDAGSRGHWEDVGLHFGDEPSDEIQDRVWECRHIFSTAKTPVSESLVQAPIATNMECSCCWNTVYPEMEFPSKVGHGARVASGYSMRYGFARSLMDRARGRGRARTMRGGSGRAPPPPLPIGFVPPGFARLPTPPGFPAPPELPGATSDHIVDAYGNSITEMEIDTNSIRSLELPQMSDMEFDAQLAVYSSSVPTTGLDKIMLGRKGGDDMGTGKGPFSFAYECSDCGVLVCEKCKKDLLDEQEVRDG